MILEERTYTLAPGRVPDYLDAVARLGLPVMRRVHGGLVGYFLPEAGPADRVVHLWAYESLADRAERRARLEDDAEWRVFLDAVLPLIERMDSRFLTATPIVPVTLETIRAANAHAS